MKRLWAIFKSRWSEQYCNDILNRLDINNFSTATLRNNVIDTNIRNAKVAKVLASDQNFKDVFDNLWTAAKEVNDIHFNIDISKLDFINVIKYDAVDKAEYKRHHDVFWTTSSLYHRKLSCIVQLTDKKNYQGGELKIEMPGEKNPKDSDLINQGSVIFFPSFVYHRVLPVTEGTRFSIVAWFEGPKWR